MRAGVRMEDMMLRRVIEIEEEKCNGCGACANACHEGAIDIINGKAVQLVVDNAVAEAPEKPAKKTAAKKTTKKSEAAEAKKEESAE